MAKEKYYVTPEMREAILINENIIRSLKAQKARSIKLLSKYEKEVRSESERPANRLMNWTRYISPYIERVIDLQIINHDLIQQYQSYVKESIKENETLLVDRNQLDGLSQDVDRFLEVILDLEKRYKESKDEATKELNILRLRVLEYNAELPLSFRKTLKGGCRVCDAKLDYKAGDGHEECRHCSEIPKAIKKAHIEKRKALIKEQIKDHLPTDKELQAMRVQEIMKDKPTVIRNYDKTYKDKSVLSPEILKTSTKRPTP